MFRLDGQWLLPIRERGFDKQVTQVGDLVDDRPGNVIGRCVPGKDETTGPGIEVIADRRDGMFGWDRRDRARPQTDFLPFRASRNGAGMVPGRQRSTASKSTTVKVET